MNGIPAQVRVYLPDGRAESHERFATHRGSRRRLAGQPRGRSNQPSLVARIASSVRDPTPKRWNNRASRPSIVFSDNQSLIENLNRVAEKLDHGPGSAAQMLNDPALYLARTDIVSGIDESRILKRLVRNRQKKGAEVRLEQELDTPLPAAPSKEP